MRWTEDELADHLQKRGVPSRARNTTDVSNPPFTVPCEPARAQVKSPELNKTEQDYADTLELMRRAGSVRWFKPHPLKLRLADNTTYEPDFGVVAQDGVFEIHEVKGFWRDDARVKIKVAASIFPFRFFAVTKRRGGGWDYEAFQ